MLELALELLSLEMLQVALELLQVALEVLELALEMLQVALVETGDAHPAAVMGAWLGGEIGNVCLASVSWHCSGQSCPERGRTARHR